MTRAGSIGYQGWLRAREQEDYSIMLPHLERNLELRRQYVACFEPTDDPYDVVLDDYEPGMKTAEVERDLRHAEGRARAAGSARSRDAEPIDDSCLRGRFPRDAQRRFALAMLERWGMDRASWRLDQHRASVRDVVGADRHPSDDELPRGHAHGILSCLHEFGHGIYERQVDPAYTRTPLAQGVSSAFHESQSRMWENLVGRNIATWRFFYPKLQEEFPEQFGDVSLETFHRALNKVQPSFRRVDADEVTYCLHIILRFELERAMLSGEVSLKDLPEAFDAKMREYLGLHPPDVVAGVLQDVHWSDMSFGYFPTYALGNVVSVQLWERAEADLGDLDEQFERGDFGAAARVAPRERPPARPRVHAAGAPAARDRLGDGSRRRTSATSSASSGSSPARRRLRTDALVLVAGADPLAERLARTSGRSGRTWAGERAP